MFDDADFEALRPDQVARFPLAELHIPRGNPKPVTLLLRWAGESNERWTAGARAAKFRAFASPQDQTRYYDELAAKTVIVGWENVLDKNGKPMPYTPEAGAELLTRLRSVSRSSLASEITLAAYDASRFTAPPVDAGDLGNG